MTSPRFEHVLTSVADLEALHPSPNPIPSAKKVDVLDAGARGIIAACPLVVVATADAAGRCTSSPRGGLPGFVRVLDEHRLVIPDYGGNNLLDSARNVLERPSIGLLFVLPGRNETLRVDGEAWVTVDPSVLDLCADRGRLPVTALGVVARTVFIHCSSSLARSRVWQPGSWQPDAAPAAKEVLMEHVRRTTEG